MDGGENISSQPLESLIRDKEQKGAESSKLAHYDVYTLTEPAKTQEGSVAGQEVISLLHFRAPFSRRRLVFSMAESPLAPSLTRPGVLEVTGLIVTTFITQH